MFLIWLVFIFLLAFGSLALIKQKRKKKTKHKRRPRWEEALLKEVWGWRKVRWNSSDTCGDCRCLFKKVEYTPGCLFSCLRKERRLCHRSWSIVEWLSFDTRRFQPLKPRWHDKQLRLVSLYFLSIISFLFKFWKYLIFHCREVCGRIHLVPTLTMVQSSYPGLVILFVLCRWLISSYLWYWDVFANVKGS